MPRFRAVVQYPPGATGKPFQIFGEDRAPMEEWCRSRAKKEPDGTPQPDGTEAVIMERTERPVFLVRKRTDLEGEPTVDDIVKGADARKD